jgi:argininosuccinate lyase
MLGLANTPGRMSDRKPWGGRFEGETDRLVEAFTESVSTDVHIAIDDVEGSMAHAQMLGEVGLLTTLESERLVSGLETVRQEITSGHFVWEVALEDVHMNVERRLAALVGESLAGKLHTARSRNDQVALDVRLYLRRKLREIQAALIDLELALITQAKAHVDTLLPGYTHLQRGQPVRLAHHLLAYREQFRRDRLRVGDVRSRAEISPLGSGALAGTPHPIDRERVAALLGFSGITVNSMDAVSDRDGLLEAMSAAAISMIHLSRLSEELVLWNSSEFGFVAIDDAFATGSSMMPQKKNPDVAELVRGKSGRVIGDLVALLVTMKGLPMTYNRDMQEDKPALYDSLDTWLSCLRVTARMVPKLDFRPEAMARALKQGFILATELADFLVGRGVPFREAHGVVGRIVQDCVKQGTVLEDLSVEALRAYRPEFDENVLVWLDAEKAVERRDVPGGPARARVLGAIQAAERELNEVARETA